MVAKGMHRSSKITLFLVGGVILALLAGYLGATIRGGGAGEEATKSSSSTAWSWVKKIRDNGELRVGVSSSPPGITEADDGTWQGFELIAPQAIADTLGVKLKTVPTTFENAVAALQANQFDMMVSLNVTPDRSLSIRFSIPHWVAEDVFLVRADSGFTSAQAVIDAGEPIAVPAGTSQDKALTARGANVLRLKSYQEANLALTSGRAVASFLDIPGAAAFASERDDVKIVVPRPSMSVQAVGYGLSPNIDESSLAYLNAELDTLLKRGVIEAAMIQSGYLTADQLGDLELKSSR